MHVAHLLVRHQYEAEDLWRRCQQGEDFAELARKYSQCPSAAQGGDLGQVNPRRLDADFVEAAEELTPGQISRPVRTKFGYHLIQRVK